MDAAGDGSCHSSDCMLCVCVWVSHSCHTRTSPGSYASQVCLKVVRHVQANIAPGELDMIFDGEDEQHTLGTYGVGLADALARKHGMLRDLPNVTEFKAVKLSVGGGFQFDMNLFQTDSPVLCDYLRMAAVIKQHYGIKPTGEQVSCLHW